MALLQILVTDELWAQLSQRAAESGVRSVEQYALAVLEASAEPALTDEQVEELLLRRASDRRPDIELTPSFRDEFREEVRRRRQARRPPALTEEELERYVRENPAPPRWWESDDDPFTPP